MRAVDEQDAFKWLILLVIPSLLLALLIPTPSGAGDAPEKKVLHWAIDGELKTLDPAVSTSANSYTVMSLCVETLYQYQYRRVPAQLEPLLAEALPRISKDGRTYTIRIKRGVRFQDDPAFPGGRGRELTAEDFIYAWKRLFLPALAASRRSIFEEHVLGMKDLKARLAAAPPEQLDEELARPVEGLAAPDRHTLRIRLDAPYPLLTKMLVQLPTAPVPPEAVKRYGNVDLSQHLVGTGPYLLKFFDRLSEILLVRNLNFRGERFSPDNGPTGRSLPFLDEIHFQVFRETQPAWLHFLKGDLDAYGVPNDDTDSAVVNDELTPELKRKGMRLQIAQDLLVKCLVLNMKDPLLGSNVVLRQAISSAIDRKKWIELFMNGHGTVATGLLPPGIEERPERMSLPWDFDLARARRLLERAGFPGGKGAPELRFEVEGASALGRQQGEFIARSLRKIGLNVMINSSASAAWFEHMVRGDHQMFTGGWLAAYADAEAFLKLGYGKFAAPGPNVSSWSDSEYDTLYERIVGMRPSRARARLIAKTEGLFVNGAAMIPLAYPKIYLLTQGWVRNLWIGNRMALNALKYVDIDIAEKRRLNGSR